MSSKTADEIYKEAEALTNWFNNLSENTSLTGYEILHLSNAMESLYTIGNDILSTCRCA